MLRQMCISTLEFCSSKWGNGPAAVQLEYLTACVWRTPLFSLWCTLVRLSRNITSLHQSQSCWRLFFPRFSTACLDYLFNKGRQPTKASPAVKAAVRMTPVWAAWSWARLLRASWARVASLVSNNTSQLTCVCRGSTLGTWLLPSWHRQLLEIRKIFICISNSAGTSQKELGIQEIQNTNLISVYLKV